MFSTSLNKTFSSFNKIKYTTLIKQKLFFLIPQCGFLFKIKKYQSFHRLPWQHFFCLAACQFVSAVFQFSQTSTKTPVYFYPSPSSHVCFYLIPKKISYNWQETPAVEVLHLTFVAGERSLLASHLRVS